MATDTHIKNPIEWVWIRLKLAGSAIESAGQSIRGAERIEPSAPGAVGRIAVADLREVLVKGVRDFAAYRTDVIFLCLIYPLIGLVLARLAFGYQMLPLIFPLVSGFALVGPVAAIGLYEMSRRRERGDDINWADAFGVVRSPAFGAILALSLLLLVIFLAWMVSAYFIYNITLGPEPPASVGAFASGIFTTGAGWAMIVLGCGVGFLFAVLVLTISVVSFPMLLDRNVGLRAAVLTSVRTVQANPVPMALWGMIVAGGLALGALPLFLGLVFVLPVLGHATWHLYRKAVPRPT